jgi:hypothetical protein
MGAKRKAYKILVGNPEGKRPLERLRCRWMDNIKMDLRDIRWAGMDWIDLVQDREQRRTLVNTVMNLRVPENVRNFLSSCTTGCFSRRAQLHGVSDIVLGDKRANGHSNKSDVSDVSLGDKHADGHRNRHCIFDFDLLLLPMQRT